MYTSRKRCFMSTSRPTEKKLKVILAAMKDATNVEREKQLPIFKDRISFAPLGEATVSDFDDDDDDDVQSETQEVIVLSDDNDDEPFTSRYSSSADYNDQHSTSSSSSYEDSDDQPSTSYSSNVNSDEQQKADDLKKNEDLIKKYLHVPTIQKSQDNLPKIQKSQERIEYEELLKVHDMSKKLDELKDRELARIDMVAEETMDYISVVQEKYNAERTAAKGHQNKYSVCERQYTDFQENRRINENIASLVCNDDNSNIYLMKKVIQKICKTCKKLKMNTLMNSSLNKTTINMQSIRIHNERQKCKLEYNRANYINLLDLYKLNASGEDDSDNDDQDTLEEECIIEIVKFNCHDIKKNLKRKSNDEIQEKYNKLKSLKTTFCQKNINDLLKIKELRTSIEQDLKIYNKSTNNTALKRMHDEKHEDPCPVCLEEKRGKDMVYFECSHTVCSKCVEELRVVAAKNKVFQCPVCRSKVENATGLHNTNGRFCFRVINNLVPRS